MRDSDGRVEVTYNPDNQDEHIVVRRPTITATHPTAGGRR